MTIEITVSVRVDAPRPEVWRALTVEVGMRPWWWAETDDVTFDLPVGENGRFRIASKKLDRAITGWLLESRPPEREVLTWLREGDAPPAGEGSFDQVTITLTPDGFGTVVDVHHETHLEATVEMERSWRELLAPLVTLYDNAN